MEQPAGRWDELDSRWDVSTGTGHEEVVDVADLLDGDNDEWTGSDAPFDTDPLSADSTGVRSLHGPRQPGKAVEWSRWSAQLLAPSAALAAELFDVTDDRAPGEVSCEAELPTAEGFRRAEVLVRHGARGLSIDVTPEDGNGEKAAQPGPDPPAGGVR